MKKGLYFDYAASTPTDARVVRAMASLWRECFENPYSIHSRGRAAKERLDEARRAIARILGVHEREIIFTSGGTEGNNLAIFGTYEYAKYKAKVTKPRVITTDIEHTSVLEPLSRLKERGAIELIKIPVTPNGSLDLSFFEKSLSGNTILVSLMYVNNETGIILPLRKVSEIILRWKRRHATKFPYFHTDASQAPRYLPVKPETLGVDLLSLDGLKIYGPKGIGVLYKKRSIALEPLFHGGGQEDGMRSGTQNVPGAVGMSVALVLSEKERARETKRLSALKEFFIAELSKRFPKAEVNGDPRNAVPGIANIFFPESKNSEELLIALDVRGIYVSLGSACGSAGERVSEVIKALFHDKVRARKSIRISFGKETKKGDVLRLVKALGEALD